MPAPLSCSFTREVPDILRELGGSLALTTYQAGKLIVLSPDGDRLSQLPRTFPQAMGMAVDGEGATLRAAVASKTAVTVLANAPGLAASYAPNPDRYDGLFVPRALYFTGALDLHDMAWGTHAGAPGLWAVNTVFSCLGLVGEAAGFTPVWRPRFVSALAPEDRCHLNGMAMDEGRPRYVTALGATDTPRGWRPNKPTGGVIVDVDSGETVAAGLAMPHSPRLIDGALWVLSSATGEVLTVDVETGATTVVTRLDGFVRGVVAWGEYVFVGRSRLRTNRTFGELPIARQELTPGVTILHAATGAIVGGLTYASTVEEIYDVQALPGLLRPGVVGPSQPASAEAIVMPEGTWWTRASAPEAAAAQAPA